MSHLDNRLDGLLELRKAKGRFRKLREYDTSRGSGLTDFVSQHRTAPHKDTKLTHSPPVIQ